MTWRERYSNAAKGLVLPLLAAAAAALAGALLLMALGKPVGPAFARIVAKSLGDWYGFGQVLRTTGQLTLMGLAVAVAFRAGLFNIGAEGQSIVAGCALGWACHLLAGAWPEGGWVTSVPRVLWWLALMALAAAVGALWASIAGALRVFCGAHEVISTILLNFLAAIVSNYMLRPEAGSLAVEGMIRTAKLPDALRLPKLSEGLSVFRGSSLNLGFFVALAAVVAVAWFLSKTRRGYEVRVVGNNPVAALWAGISVGRTSLLAIAMGGALAGLAAFEAVIGTRGWYEEGLTSGLGFTGIAVALLAANRPWAIPAAAFFFAALSYGRVAAGSDIPKDVVDVMQAAAVITMAAGLALAARPPRRKRSTSGDSAPPAPSDKSPEPA